MRALRRLIAVAATVLCLSVAMSSSAFATGDDYPWRTSTTNTADRWGFTQRQCVSFVAWREAQHMHSLNNYTQHWGSALNWDNVAASRGYTISTRPVAGAIAQWNAYETSPWWANGSSTANGTIQAGGYGHVGWVRSVNSDGSVWVEQYNMFGTRSYSVMRLKAPRYIYYGVG